jgi:chemotaxis protein CheY-P-specific phosphatase CheC
MVYKISNKKSVKIDHDVHDCYQEVVSIAMQRAVLMLKNLFNADVEYPHPNVNFLEGGELHMELNAVMDKGNKVLTVCQGFIGLGVAGEALLVFNNTSYEEIARLAKYDDKLDNIIKRELLLDLANVLFGACLHAIGDQIDCKFNQRHPVLLGQHQNIFKIIENNKERWRKTLAFESGYIFKNHKISCDLLIIFTEKSLEVLSDRASYLIG